MDKPIGLTIRVLDGPAWQLQSQRGNVVFMNFFATWCGPCMEETPALVASAARNLDAVTLVGVDVGESDDKVRKSRKQYGVPYTIRMDQKQIFYANIGMRVFPTTLIFPANGQLSCAFVGIMDADDFDNEHAYALDPSRAEPHAS